MNGLLKWLGIHVHTFSMWRIEHELFNVDTDGVERLKGYVQTRHCAQCGLTEFQRTKLV